jgi:predicted permease
VGFPTFRRLKALFVRRTLETDLDKEMRLHLDMLAEQYQRSGMSPEDAARAARRQFGNLESLKDRGRDVRGAGAAGDALRDVRYAARIFRHSPIFAAVVVLSLALGIGANTALFSLVDAKFLRSLPVDQPHQLVSFSWASDGWAPEIRGGAVSGRDFKSSGYFSVFAFEQFRAAATTLSDVIAVAPTFEGSAGIDGQPESVRAQLVSGNYFTGLRVPMIAGRTLTLDDDHTLAAPAAVISYGFWQRRFAQNPDVIGKKVFLNGLSITIVGVSSPEFRGTDSGRSAPAFSIPLAFAPRLRQWGPDLEQRAWWLRIIGRMKPAIAVHQVRGELEGVMRGVAQKSATAAPGVVRLEVQSANRGFDLGPNRLQVLITLGAVFGFLLLVVCLNVANMLLARAAARQYEIGVRLAMGAGRVRLIRLLLTESVLLALAGGAIGAVLAYWGKDVFTLLRLLGEDFDLRIDFRVLVFTATVSLVVGVLFGLAPAFRATNIDVSSAVKKSLQTSAPVRLHLARWVLIAQVAVSAVLLMGAGLFLRTLQTWRSIDAGFDTDNMLVFNVNPGTLQYGEDRTAELYERIIQRVRSIPGVLAITTSDNFWAYWWPAMRIPGDTRYRPVRALSVRPNFFEVMGMRLLAGREFTSADSKGSLPVAIIDESVALRYFPNMSPIGRRFGLYENRNDDIEIVGIVKDMRIPGPRKDDIRPMVFIPESQNLSGVGWGRSLEIRTAGDPLVLAPTIIKVVAEIDPALPLVDIKTMNDGLKERLNTTRYFSITWSMFGVAGALLTCIGLYGLVSYGVARRTQEIGLRIALGAGRFRIIRLVVGHTLWLVFLGVAIGLVASLGLNQVIQSLIFGVPVYDPLTGLVVTALMIAVTGIAAYLPAHTAARVDPTVSLRYE